MVMLAVFALGLLSASWLGWPVLAGACFVIGSVAAVLYVRPGDLLMVTIVPPLLFGVTLVGVKAATATGSVRCPSPRDGDHDGGGGAVAVRRDGADPGHRLGPRPARCASVS